MQTCIANSKPELKILSERLLRENLVEFSVSVKTFTKNLSGNIQKQLHLEEIYVIYLVKNTIVYSCYISLKFQFAVKSIKLILNT